MAAPVSLLAFISCSHPLRAYVGRCPPICFGLSAAGRNALWTQEYRRAGERVNARRAVISGKKGQKEGRRAPDRPICVILRLFAVHFGVLGASGAPGSLKVPILGLKREKLGFSGRK
jgi:hypothetical protein